jgi:hypothetical protein
MSTIFLKLEIPENSVIKRTRLHPLFALLPTLQGIQLVSLSLKCKIELNKDRWRKGNYLRTMKIPQYPMTFDPKILISVDDTMLDFFHQYILFFSYFYCNTLEPTSHGMNIGKIL